MVAVVSSCRNVRPSTGNYERDTRDASKYSIIHYIYIRCLYLLRCKRRYGFLNIRWIKRGYEYRYGHGFLNMVWKGLEEEGGASCSCVHPLGSGLSFLYQIKKKRKKNPKLRSSLFILDFYHEFVVLWDSCGAWSNCRRRERRSTVLSCERYNNQNPFYIYLTTNLLKWKTFSKKKF